MGYEGRVVGGPEGGQSAARDPGVKDLMGCKGEQQGNNVYEDQGQPGNPAINVNINVNTVYS